MFFLGIWFVFQLWEGGFSILQPQAGGGVAFFAHIGGFVFGVLTVRLVAIRQPLSRPTMVDLRGARPAGSRRAPAQSSPQGCENVAVVVEDENPEEPDLYGLFRTLPEFLPAKVTIYRRAAEKPTFRTPERLEHEIRVTVLHELAHYFGIDEDRLAELGYA